MAISNNAKEIQAWFQNDEYFNMLARDCLSVSKTKNEAAHKIMQILIGNRVFYTYDKHIPFTYTSVRYALREF